jgi:CheY-like chemotaxis protein
MRKPSATILVVDDDEDVLTMASACLSEQGYEVLQAKNGVEGLDILEQDVRVDLLFTDIVMPGKIDGFELAHRARRLRPKIRILYTSGFLKELPRAEQAGHGDLLPKPWKITRLEDAVKRALS